MKILQIINSLATGGAEKLLLETIPLYVEQGIEMDILVLNGTDYPFMEKLKSLKCCTVHSLGKGSVYNPKFIFKIIPFLKKHDIVHVHLFPAQYWAVLAKWISLSKVKLVFTEHNTYNRRMNSKFFRFCDRFIYSGYENVICITEEVKLILKSHLKTGEDKFTVIKNGINLEMIRSCISYEQTSISSKILQGDKLLIQVAGFRKQKDQATLIKALQYLPDNIKLLLVGNGILKQENEKLTYELGLQDQVIFLGSRMDVPNLLKTADIIILSSKYEGLSLSSIEGMAFGKPFIASDVPGLTEIVKDAGILFSVGNDVQLSNEIKELLSDEQHYKSVAEKCLERALEYDITYMVEKHINLYESIL